MDLIIKNASLDELTAICYRIGEPNFQEMVEAHRKFGVVEYLVNHGENLNSAIDTYDSDLQGTKTKVALESNRDDLPEVQAIVQEAILDEADIDTKPVGPVDTSKPAEETKPAQEVKQEELHLDKPPEPAKQSAVNLGDSLHHLATDLVNSGKSKELIKILNSFGANSVPELNKSHYEAAIEKIKGVLNGGA